MQSFINILLILSGVLTFEQESVPQAIISKDSLAFHIPVDDPISIRVWNALPGGTVEHEWIFDLPFTERTPPGRRLCAHFAVIQESAGPPESRGSIAELINNSRAYFWVTDATTTDLNDNDKTSLLPPKYEDGLISFVAIRPGLIEYIKLHRPDTATLRRFGYGSDGITEDALVKNMRDPKEEIARNLVGPLSPEEYVVYETVVERILSLYSRFQRSEYPLYVITPAFTGEFFKHEEQTVANMQADSATVFDYIKRRKESVDLKSLAMLGYTVVNPDSFQSLVRRENYSGTAHSVRLSRVGFNADRTQAAVFYEYYCGSLCGRGEVVLLEIYDGEWLIRERVPIYFS